MRRWMLLVALPLACEEMSAPDLTVGEPEPTPRPAEDAGVPEAGSGAPAEPPVTNCDALRAPVTYKIRRGPKASEDFVFDRDGMLISINGGNVWKSPFTGAPTLFAPGRFKGASGTRLLPNGDLIVAEMAEDGGFLARITPDGTLSKLASGFDYPNGIEIDLAGFVYVADQSKQQVVRVDGQSGESQVLVRGMGLEGPNGVTFSPDYGTLYIGDFESGQIFALEMNPDGTAGAMRVVASGIGKRSLDGLGVDECGNVYVDEFAARRIYRIAPGTGERVLVADMSRDSLWIPNMQWGSGVGGWDPRILYVIDREKNQVYELDVGVRSKRVAHLP